MKVIDSFLPKLMGKNLKSTSKETIVDQMLEARPLPMGRKDFETWSNRIISGSLVPGGAEDYEAFIDSQKCILAGMILHLGPTESHKPDAFFIHSLRKAAVNEVAHAIGSELRQKAKTRLMEKEAKEAEEEEKKQSL